MGKKKYVAILFDGHRVTVDSDYFTDEHKAWDELEDNQHGFIISATKAAKLIKDLQAQFNL